MPDLHIAYFIYIYMHMHMQNAIDSASTVHLAVGVRGMLCDTPVSHLRPHGNDAAVFRMTETDALH